MLMSSHKVLCFILFCFPLVTNAYTLRTYCFRDGDDVEHKTWASGGG